MLSCVGSGRCTQSRLVSVAPCIICFGLIKRLIDKETYYSLDSSKAKIHASTAMTKTKKKAEKVIKTINSFHFEESEKPLIGESELDPVI